MLIAESLSTLHHDTAPIHVCLPPRRTWLTAVFLMPMWAILKGFAHCLPYPKICLMPVMLSHISLTMCIGSVFTSCIVSTFFAKRNIHPRTYILCSSEVCIVCTTCIACTIYIYNMYSINGMYCTIV